MNYEIRGEGISIAKRIRKSGHNVRLIPESTLLENDKFAKPDVIINTTSKALQTPIPVVGASRFSLALQQDRDYARAILTSCGIDMLPLYFVENNKDAEKFVKDSCIIACQNIIYRPKNKEDAFCFLASCSGEILIQELTEGEELVVEGWFNGHSFVDNPYIVFCKGQLIKTIDKRTKLFKESLGKLTHILRRAGHKGPVGLQIILNEDKLFALGFLFTFRYAYFELIKIPFERFLYEVAISSLINAKTSKDYAIQIPIISELPGMAVRGLDEEKEKHIWLENIEKKEDDIFSKGYHFGYITARGTSIREAKRRAMRTLNNLTLPALLHQNIQMVQVLDKQQKWFSVTSEQHKEKQHNS